MVCHLPQSASFLQWVTWAAAHQKVMLAMESRMVRLAFFVTPVKLANLSAMVLH
uniref:Uncharacterized protein n=1 Tax=Parascaris univalens TaxID=6257 RepID=A0A915CBV9_PARUN